ncbi:MAG: hypothetical protein Q8P18_16705 [Pseudomonadota bacterium]|nr:hypothetical protein [Pseudomonadota bacterium]
MRHRNLVGLSCLTALVGGAVALSALAVPAPRGDEPTVVSGPSRAKALAAAFQRWETEYQAAGGDRARVLSMYYSDALSSEPTEAWGQVKLDLVEGRVEAGVVGADGPVDLWVVKNVPGERRSVRPEDGDQIELVGTLTPVNGQAHLEATLPADFPIDLVVVTRAGTRPEDGALLVGYTTLFHRLHDRAQTAQIAVLAPRTQDPTLAGALGPNSAEAAVVPSNPYVPSMEEMIAQGEELFTKETFEGNGRTCASCHPPLNNFTIDQDWIADLSDYDPLFVAEFDPELSDLEDPELMREFALIRENQDGFDALEDRHDPKRFNMRSVPHTLAMTMSLQSFILNPDGSRGEEFQQIGWSGDGSTNGTELSMRALRDFTLGAIRQHFPQTLEREEGYDFRFATEDELIAMEAFQMSLGRQEDIDLTTMTFKDAKVTAGLAVFNAKACGLCHANAGANDIAAHPRGDAAIIHDLNVNLNTGVETLELDETLGMRPTDGGFGGAPDGATPLLAFLDQNGDGKTDFPPDASFNCADEVITSGGFGDGTFNIPPLIEAADTPPFFHNNAVETLEESVAFYGTSNFNCSPAGSLIGLVIPGGLVFAPGEVDQLTAFLRALNALENIRASDTYLDDAYTERRLAYAKPKILAALADLDDGLTVLAESRIHRYDAYPELQKAIVYLKTASRVTSYQTRNVLIARAQANLDKAKGYIKN